MKPRRAIQMTPGYDGAVEIDTHVRITATRSEARSLRCRPGTFSWRYARDGAPTALYHAGCDFAILWEKAGTASASSPDLGAVGGGMWRGVQVGRLEAMDKIDAARKDIGRWATARLVDYCVMGSTASDMATKYGYDDRHMAIILNEDLKACALHFEYL
ncbi:hypothetical protein CIT31_16700 [Mesorhizobium wenxiniae]|uniref:Uncharacterized protein n=2 Tax=Mesorhizobium wenxiniae TaxID=2014805 RepID=A0A271KG50_9HYPH|nr:hypothetical protein CIT31_16700 [Mesorhizobium wenxiniae]